MPCRLYTLLREDTWAPHSPCLQRRPCAISPIFNPKPNNWPLPQMVKERLGDGIGARHTKLDSPRASPSGRGGFKTLVHM